MLVHEVKDRLAPGCTPPFTPDGLRSYFYALIAHFGRWVKPQEARTAHLQVNDTLLYGQLVKRRGVTSSSPTYTCCGASAAT